MLLTYNKNVSDNIEAIKYNTVEITVPFSSSTSSNHLFLKFTFNQLVQL